jgi:hypothetical protein
MAKRRQPRPVAFRRTLSVCVGASLLANAADKRPTDKAKIRSTLKSHYPWRRDSLILFAVYGYSSRQDNLT